jgi:thiol-disulfide isomerase/thioredoxin
MLLTLLLMGLDGWAQQLVGIKLVKQLGRGNERSYIFTYTSLTDSVLPRGRVPRAIKRGIVKKHTFRNFAGSKEEVLLLVGQNQSGDQIGVVTDANRNGDFRDDQLLWFKNDSSQGIKARQYSRVLVSSPKGSVPFIIAPIPYHDMIRYNRRLESKYYLRVGIGERLAGQLPTANPADSIQVVNDDVSPVYQNVRQRTIFLLPSSSQPEREYRFGDVLTLHDRSFVAVRLTPLGDSLYLRPIAAEDRKYYGISEGSLLPTQTLHDLKGQPVVLPAPHQRVLLDFWGTWCGPCRELTPMLQALHQAHPKDLRMVSIALDEKAPVANYLQAHPMPWEQVAISREEATKSIIGQLRVEAYPTFILIQDGLIVYRGTGETGLLAVKKYLVDNPLPGH